MKESLILGIMCVIAFITLFFLFETSKEDYYIVRDNCLYHFTQRYNGTNIESHYTKVTCDTLEFKNYVIKK